jgi:hypothetical protein
LRGNGSRGNYEDSSVPIAGLTNSPSTDVVKSTFGYDTLGRLTALDHVDVAEVSTPVARAGYTWQYDKFNRLLEATERFNGDPATDRALTHTYDHNGQLLSTIVELPSPAANVETYYTYDANGNRTSGQTPDADNYNRVLSDGTYSYRYDDEGNQTARTAIDNGNREAFAWDHRNRLTSIATQVPREVAHWRFDGDATNATGDSALDGTLVGNPVYSGTGAPIAGGGGSLELDGTGDYVSMGDEDALKLRTHDLSVSFWVYIDVDELAGLMGQGRPSIVSEAMGYEFIYWGANSTIKLDLRVNDGSGGHQALSIFPGALSGSWHHLAATIDRDGDLSLYLDGELGASAAFTQTVNADIIGSTAFVGGAFMGSVAAFDGKLDDLLFRTVLRGSSRSRWDQSDSELTRSERRRSPTGYARPSSYRGKSHCWLGLFHFHGAGSLWKMFVLSSARLLHKSVVRFPWCGLAVDFGCGRLRDRVSCAVRIAQFLERGVQWPPRM